MKRITVAMVGAGWAGTMHARAYNRVYGCAPVLKTVCALDDGMDEFAKRYGFARHTGSFEEVLADTEIDVVDIITPPYLHKDMILAALRAGKHVICEKPVTGYFGLPEDEKPVGRVSKEKMLANVVGQMNEIETAIAECGKQFFYAEQWVYSPVFRRACELVQKKKTKLLEIRGITGHRGSHAPHAARWDKNGGGALIRQGTHPVAAAITLKRQEMLARGETFGIRSVLCDASAVTGEITDKGYLAGRPVDVEDWAQLILTFSDGTKATITAGDIYLGEVLNIVEAYGNDAYFKCNMTPNDLLDLYFADETGVSGEEIAEKSVHNLGRLHASVEDEFIRGYDGEIQDFLTCLSAGKQAISGFELAKETLKVIYAGYLSAETGTLVRIDDWR